MQTPDGLQPVAGSPHPPPLALFLVLSSELLGALPPHWIHY